MKHKSILICLVLFLFGFQAIAQENPFLGRWAIQTIGLPYGDGKMNLVIASGESYVAQGSDKVVLEEVIIDKDNFSATYQIGGYPVKIKLALQKDGSLKGKMADTFEMTGTRTEGTSVVVPEVGSHAYKPVSIEDLQGNWYGLYSGSPLTLTVEGNKMALVSEAFSSMNMNCEFSLKEGEPTGMSISAGAGMMVGEGLCAIDKDKLELLLVFGVPGQVSAPKSFDDGAGNPAASRFTLSRDKEIVEKATAKVDAPSAAALAFERNKRIGNGVNLNAVLDGLSGDKPIKDGVIKSIAKAGFNSVRIPIRWGDHTIKTAPYTIDPEFFKKVDSIVDECLKEGLAVTVDNHYYPVISFGFGPQDLSFEENIDRLYCIWEQLSAHYKDYSDETLFFELMNEPSLRLAPSLWNEIVASCVKIIRHDNPGKTVIVTTPSLGQHWTIGLLRFPENEWNMIVDAHYYLPQTFTHQGLAYAMAGGLKDIKWDGTEADKAPLDQDFAFLARWSERTGRPVNIGEYGVCSNADGSSKARYLAYIRSLIKKYGFSSNLWAFHRDTFQVYDEKTGKYDNSMLKAIK